MHKRTYYHSSAWPAPFPSFLDESSFVAMADEAAGDGDGSSADDGQQGQQGGKLPPSNDEASSTIDFNLADEAFARMSLTKEQK